MTNLIIIVSSLFLTVDANIQDVVKEFHHLKTEEAEIQFIKKYKQSTDPSVLAYVVSIEMKQAEYFFNPYNKLKVFRTNRKRLDTLIKQYDANIHLRYVRLMVQLNAPTILGYNDFIEEDKLFLKSKLDESDTTDFLDAYIKDNTPL